MANPEERKAQEQQRTDYEAQLRKAEKAVSEEQERKIKTKLRGGRNVDEQEDERGILGASPQQSGSLQGEMARDYGTREEQKGDSAKPSGRRKNESHH